MPCSMRCLRISSIPNITVWGTRRVESILLGVSYARRPPLALVLVVFLSLAQMPSLAGGGASSKESLAHDLAMNHAQLEAMPIISPTPSANSVASDATLAYVFVDAPRSGEVVVDTYGSTPGFGGRVTWVNDSPTEIDLVIDRGGATLEYHNIDPSQTLYIRFSDAGRVKWKITLGTMWLTFWVGTPERIPG